MYIKLIYSYLVHGHLLPITKEDLRKTYYVELEIMKIHKEGENVKFLRAHEKSTDLIDPLRNRNHIQRGKSHQYSIQKSQLTFKVQVFFFIL